MLMSMRNYPYVLDVEIITRNKIQCLHCKEIIESVHTHDFRFCKCGTVAVDGGKSYRKRMYNKDTDYIELSEFHVEKRKYDLDSDGLLVWTKVAP